MYVDVFGPGQQVPFEVLNVQEADLSIPEFTRANLRAAVAAADLKALRHANREGSINAPHYHLNPTGRI